MENKQRRAYVTATIMLCLFILLILALKYIDLAKVYAGNVIGLSSLNIASLEFFGSSKTWSAVSDWTALIALILAAYFAVLGLIQWKRRKKLLAVNRKLLLLYGLYAAIIVLYFLFEIFPVNYRPVLTQNDLEPSFPSTHTTVVLTVMTTGAIAVKSISNNKIAFSAFSIVSASLCLFAVVGRLLSGMHWLTDVIGAVLLSAALSSLYYGTTQNTDRKSASD